MKRNLTTAALVALLMVFTFFFIGYLENKSKPTKVHNLQQRIKIPRHG